MDPQYKNRFTPEIKTEIARRYGIPVEDLHALDGFESFIFEFAWNGRDYILRVGHSHRRPESLVQGEAEWLRYLQMSGTASVAAPVESRPGSLVEVFDDGHGASFVATAFEKAPGRHMRQADAVPELFETWGALLGRIHALSVDFRPQFPRPHWDDPLMLDTAELLPRSEASVLQRYQALRAHLDTLPRTDPLVYGMIHQDAHAGNFFIHEGQDGSTAITLFDFDDCCFSWYPNDIAIVLFYAVMGQPDEAGFTRTFLTHFLRGYRREKEIDSTWLAEIPNFLKLREIDLYAVIHRSFDVTNITNPWVQRFMNGRKERLESGTAFLEFDFTTLDRP